MLFLDGHGSHLNLTFLEWCLQHKILVAWYPPHSTHRLQPLDVGCFAPLASYCSQGLDCLIRRSEGHTVVKKRDFFALFWPAFQQAFIKEVITSAWLKAGIWPFDPQAVLMHLPEQHTPHLPTSLRARRGTRAQVHQAYLTLPHRPRRSDTL